MQKAMSSGPLLKRDTVIRSGASTPQQRQIDSQEPAMVTVDLGDSCGAVPQGCALEKKRALDDHRHGSVTKQFSLGMAQDSESPLARDEAIPALHIH